MTGLVGILAAVYLFQLLCFIMPVNRHKMFRPGSLLGTEPLEGLNECWKNDSTAKLAQTALNEFAAWEVNMAGNHKVKLSKNTTSALAYYLYLLLLLSSGNVEWNPGPESISQNRNFKLSMVKGLRICYLNVRSLVNKIDEMRLFLWDPPKARSVPERNLARFINQQRWNSASRLLTWTKR